MSEHEEIDNLPAVRTSTAAVVARDTDSWAERLPDVVELSRAIANTEFVPESLRGNIAATAAAILYGREVGLPPMTALNNVNVIKGRPGLSANIMRAQVLAAGHEIQQVESTAGRCILRGRRRGTDYWQTVEFTIDDAKQGGFIKRGKNGGPSPYETIPRRMLRARATTELCELMFADVVRGMPSIEDLEAVDDDETPAPAATTRGKVQRKQRTPQTDDGAVSTPLPSGTDSSPAPSSPPMPPLPGEPGYDDMAQTPAPAGEIATSTTEPTQGGSGPADASDPGSGEAVSDRRVSGRSVEDPPGQAPQDEVPMNTRAQQRGLFALFKSVGIVDDAERLQVTADLIGRMPMHKDEPSWHGLTWDEANTLTTMMSTVKNRDQVEALIEIAEQQRAGGDEA